jgi:hypothetical protein
MLLEFEFKTGFSRLYADIDTAKSFEEIVSVIWNSEIVYLLGNKSTSFKAENLMWIGEQ